MYSLRVRACACAREEKDDVSIHGGKAFREMSFLSTVFAHVLDKLHIHYRRIISPHMLSPPLIAPWTVSFFFFFLFFFFMQPCEMSPCYECIPSVMARWPVSNHVPE